jgi:hypothetical protein
MLREIVALDWWMCKRKGNSHVDVSLSSLKILSLMLQAMSHMVSK